jgi:hypothetical protein
VSAAVVPASKLARIVHAHRDQAVGGLFISVLRRAILDARQL